MASTASVHKKLSIEYDRIMTLYHEAGHAIFGLLTLKKVTSVLIHEANRVGGFTNYLSFQLDRITDPNILYFAVESEIGMQYAGLAAEKLYYKKMCGSDKLPILIKEGSSSDNTEASRLIKTHNIVQAGKKRTAYKKKTFRKVTNLINEYWEEITLLVHALHNRKRIFYSEIKKIILKSSKKDFWKEQFSKIEDLHSRLAPEEHIKL